MISVKLIYGKEDLDTTNQIRYHLTNCLERGKSIEGFEELDSLSKTFLVKRTANSLLSRYAATTPFLLFYKEGVVVSALYNESVKDYGQWEDMILLKLTEAKHAIPKHDIVEESFDTPI